MAAPKWFQVQNKGNTGELYIYGVIDEQSWDDTVSPKDVKSELDKLKKVSILNMYINSPGGSVFAGLAVYNILKRLKCKLNAYVDGLAASIASIITLAADHITVAEHSMFMIHDPMAMAMGDSEEMRRTADLLDKTKDILVDVYQKKSALSIEKISSMMSDETWFTGKEAMEIGFADACNDTTVTACFNGNEVVLNGQCIDISKYKAFPRCKVIEKRPEEYYNNYRKQISDLQKGV